jgi:tetratricopeptide (TPR) repeat protein
MSRISSGFAASAVVLAFLASGAPARAEGDAVARAVVASEAEAKGDFDAWLPELVAAAARDPASASAMAALSKIEAVMGGASDPSVVEKAFDPVLARGVADGEIDEKIRDLLAARARARGEFDAAKKYGQDRGYLRRFAVAGPFGWSASALVHRKYAPERRELDPAAAMDGHWGPVRWLPLPVLGEGAWVNPGDQIRRGQGVVYALGRLKSAAARTVLLKVFCRDSFAVFVNGEAAVVADRERDSVPEAAWATVRLESGWNRVLVKVAGNAAFAMKVCDAADAKPVLDLEEGDPLGGAELPAPTGEADARTYKTPAERAVAAAGSDPAAGAAAAYTCADEGRDWDAYVAFESAAKSVDGGGDKTLAGNVHAGFGRFLATFREFPEVERKLRAKEQFAAANAAWPTHNSAVVRLAEYENDDDHPDKAVKALREQLKARPTTTAWNSMARICRARNWEREGIDAANEALALAKNNGEALNFLLGFDKKYGNAAQASARVKRLLEIDANDGGARNESVGQLRAQGKHEEALAAVREYAARWPGQLGWRSQIASLLSALGRDDEALVEWRALSQLVPQDPAYPRSIAQVLETKGDTAGAADHYKKSLALEPFQPAVWRAVARIEGTDVDFGAPYEPNVDELIKELPTAAALKEKYPKAVAVTALDHCVTSVREDGCAQSYVHMVWKLLDEKAVKKYGDVQNMGDLLVVRAFVPKKKIGEGKDARWDDSEGYEVKEPTGLPGRAYNMEGLVPGTIIDYRCLTTTRVTPKGYDGGQFTFQDTEFGDEPNPVMLSRLVVIAPEGKKLDPVKRNYEGEPKVEKKDGLVVTTWEKREMARIEPERYMPQADEIVPLVDYSLQSSYEDVNWQMLQRRDNSRSTPILADAVGKVVKEGMTDLEKLHALYDFVNDTITGESGGREGPTATLLAKAGDRGRLFEALVRLAGVPYEYGNAMHWNGEGREGPTRIDASAFNAEFLLLEPRGAAAVPFVMESRLSPFGLLPESYRGSVAYVAGEAGGRIIRLPDGGPDVTNSSVFEIRLGEDVKATRLAGSVHYRGNQYYGWKKDVLETPEDERRKWAEQTLSRYFATPTLDKFEFPEVEKRGAPFEMKFEGTMPNYVQPQGDAFVAALGLPRINMSQRFVERAERVYDLVLNVRDDRLDEFTIFLGDSFRLKTLPEDHVVFDRLGTYSLTWRDLGDRVVVRREAHLHPARYRADAYKTFVAWCKGIDDAEERKLEFKKAK